MRKATSPFAIGGLPPGGGRRVGPAGHGRLSGRAACAKEVGLPHRAGGAGAARGRPLGVCPRQAPGEAPSPSPPPAVVWLPAAEASKLFRLFERRCAVYVKCLSAPLRLGVPRRGEAQAACNAVTNDGKRTCDRPWAERGACSRLPECLTPDIQRVFPSSCGGTGAVWRVIREQRSAGSGFSKCIGKPTNAGRPWDG